MSWCDTYLENNKYALIDKLKQDTEIDKSCPSLKEFFKFLIEKIVPKEESGDIGELQKYVMLSPDIPKNINSFKQIINDGLKIVENTQIDSLVVISGYPGCAQEKIVNGFKDILKGLPNFLDEKYTNPRLTYGQYYIGKNMETIPTYQIF